MKPAGKHPCPSCGECAGVPLVWGTPSEETWKAAQRGELVLAGCVIDPFGAAIPDFACLNCSHRWHGDAQ